MSVEEGTGFLKSQGVRFGPKSATQGTIVSLKLEYELNSDASVNLQEIENQYRQLVNSVLKVTPRQA